MTKRKTIIICVILGIFAIAFLSTIIILTNNSSNKNTTPPQNVEYSQFNQTINDIDWLVKYDGNTDSIVSISANFSEVDKSSKYWQEISRQYGDSSLCVIHQFILNGTPIGDGWFRIEKQETYTFNETILYNSISRVEEKLIFILP